MKVTAAIKEFLERNSPEWIRPLYTEEMEVQVNVEDFGLTKQKGETKSGRTYTYYEDDKGNRWKPIRIPYNSKNGPPEWDDNKNLWFPLAKYAKGIATTGWNWGQLTSLWVVYDLDAIANHPGCGVEDEAMKEIVEALSKIPWVTVVTSKSNTGYHFYVFILNSPRVANHTEHQAIGKAILNKICALTGLNLNTNFDACGSTHFIWHRETKPGGLEIVKQGEFLERVPDGWPELVKRETKRRHVDNGIGNPEDLDKLNAANLRVPLDYNHKQVLHALDARNAQWWFDKDNWLVVCYTGDLAAIHEELNLKGTFSTSASGKSPEHNCFMHPVPGGAWAVRRFGKGTGETDDWEDKNGWTFCYFNRVPSVAECLDKAGAVKDGNKWLVSKDQLEKLFATFRVAAEAPFDRQYKVTHTENSFIVKLKRKNDDPEDLDGWVLDGRTWVFNSRVPVATAGRANLGDEIIRAAYDPIKDRKVYWNFTPNSQMWQSITISEARLMLKGAHDMQCDDIDMHLGHQIQSPKVLVTVPFVDEYPTAHEWNKDGAKLLYSPNYTGSGYAPTWDLMFAHIFQNIDAQVRKYEWCKANGIYTGAQYGKVWLAFGLREPHKRAPYLFLWSEEQNTGKSTLKEAIGLLIDDAGIVDCAAALSNADKDFNGELMGKVFGYIEEKDLGHSRGLYDKVKKWVTDSKIQIEGKGKDPVVVQNYLRFLHSAQSPDRAPIMGRDTRIQMIQVEPIAKTDYIDSETFFGRLRSEAPNFMAELMSIQLPERLHERLVLPVFTSAARDELMAARKEPEELFIEDCCHLAPGAKEKLSDVYEAYCNWAAENGMRKKLTKIAFRQRLLTRKCPVGKIAGQMYIGNLSLEATSHETFRYIKNGSANLEKEAL